MDLSVFFQRKAERDIDTTVELALIKRLRLTIDNKIIKCHVFFGRWSSSECAPFLDAFASVTQKLKPLGIEIYLEIFNNDIIFQAGWDPQALINCLLSADIHILACLLHQNALARAHSVGPFSWTMVSVLEGILRLRNHLGYPCGSHVFCPLLTQNIAVLYKLLYPLGLCATYTVVSIAESTLSDGDNEKLQR